jgi:site-specific DNA-methyltransferase (adenine-specific)
MKCQCGHEFEPEIKYRHRLVCGDCTDPDVVDLVMDGEKADCVVTDPPYGVDYVGKTDDALTIQNDGADDLLGLLSESLCMAFDVSRDGACWYIAAPAGPQFYDFATVLKSIGVWRQTIVWVKNTMVLGHSDYHYRHEVLFYGWKPGADHHAPLDRKQTTVWEYDKPSASREHPTMKPVELCENALRHGSDSSDVVFDPFLGSGTTAVACERLGRQCRGIEIEPKYVAVALQRLADMGLEPELLE